MPYILAYLLILLDISILPSILEPFVVWSLGYLIIISNLYKKDPLDPRIWLFLGVGILLINGFSGILYVPSNINEQRIIIYVMLTIFSFHLGFGKLENANYAILLRRRLRNVFNSYSSYSNKIHVLLGLLGIIGSLMICFEMFVLLGVSMDDGGERRRQFQELFPLMVLTPIGTILLGGSFPSIFSVFCGGSKINILLGLVNILALALSSMAIAGKQGILFVTLILAYIYFFHKCYRIKIKIPVYVKYCIFAINVLMGIYKIDPFFCKFQLISLIPLLSSIYWIYRFCDTPQIYKILEYKSGGKFIYFISTLTLEIYMVQYAIFTDKLNNIFPLNIIIIYIIIFIAAYLLKCTAHLFSQVFSNEPFNNKNIYQV